MVGLTELLEPSGSSQFALFEYGMTRTDEVVGLAALPGYGNLGTATSKWHFPRLQ